MLETIPILKADARGLVVYGLREYVSLISGGAMWTYNFKKHNRDAVRVEALVRGLAEHLGCSAIAAIPGSGTAANNLQRIFGTSIRRTVAVPQRKTNHTATLPADYGQSYVIEWAAFVGKRVLLVDDVVTSGATLEHFANAFASNKIETVPAALGLNYRLKPVSAESMEIDLPEPAPKVGAGWRWVSLKEASERLGPSVSYLTGLCKHADYPLEYKSVGGSWQVQINAIKDWLKKHASSRSPKLNESLNYDAPREIDGAGGGDLSEDDEDILACEPRDILHGVNPNATGGLEKEKVKIMKADAYRRLNDSEIRQKRLLEPDDVRKMLRSFGEVFVETIESQSAAQAAEFVKKLEAAGINVREINCGAHAIFRQIICEQANATIDAVRAEVKRQVEGVELLEGTA